MAAREVIDLCGGSNLASAKRKRSRVEVIALSDDDDAQDKCRKAPVARASGAPSQPTLPTVPKWAHLRGVKRVMGEFKDLQALVCKSEIPIEDLTCVGDDVMTWRFKVRRFDESFAGGRQMNADIAELKRTRGMDHVLLEINFPREYPAKPFALRVVSPRMCWYTGHVTVRFFFGAGGGGVGGRAQRGADGDLTTRGQLGPRRRAAPCAWRC